MVEWPGMVLDAGFREYPSELLVLGLNGIPSEPAVRWQVRPRVQSMEGRSWEKRIRTAIELINLVIQTLQTLLVVNQLAGN